MNEKSGKITCVICICVSWKRKKTGKNYRWSCLFFTNYTQYKNWVYRAEQREPFVLVLVFITIIYNQFQFKSNKNDVIIPIRFLIISRHSKYKD